MTSLDRMLGDRIRTAIHDPARYTDRRGAAEDHAVELRSEWTARAVVLAIERGLFENDCRIVPGKTLFELEQRAGHAQTPVPGPESAADGPTALPEGPGGVETPNGAHRGDQRNDAGLLAFIVRDLMDAAGYDYKPERPLSEQARECCAEIRDAWKKRRAAERQLIVAVDRHAAEAQRLTDLRDELRKQLEAALRVAEHPTILAWRRTAAEMPTPAEWNELMQDDQDQRDRVANLDRLLQERDTLIEAACPCGPNAPQHEHLTGGYADWTNEGAEINTCPTSDGATP